MGETYILLLAEPGFMTSQYKQLIAALITVGTTCHSTTVV